jgi:hypothetical protein
MEVFLKLKGKIHLYNLKKSFINVSRALEERPQSALRVPAERPQNARRERESSLRVFKVNVPAERPQSARRAPAERPQSARRAPVDRESSLRALYNLYKKQFYKCK